MTEVKVRQRSPEWYDLRHAMMLTSSQFADAAGLGRGKPADYLMALVQGDNEPDDNSYIKHGVAMEPIIREAYQLLTGYDVEESGFWLRDQGVTSHPAFGASPDGKVMQVTSTGEKKCIGLVEFKAPVHQLYANGSKHGIPRSHMAQVQGQMAVCRQPWCDYMAVCVAKKELLLKRVYFCPSYWYALSSRLNKFCECLKECRRLKDISRLYTFPLTQRAPSSLVSLPEEKDLVAEDLLELGSQGMRCKNSNRSFFMTFDFLIGAKG